MKRIFHCRRWCRYSLPISLRDLLWKPGPTMANLWDQVRVCREVE